MQGADLTTGLTKPLTQQDEREREMFLLAQPGELVDAATRVHAASRRFGSMQEQAALEYTDVLLKHARTPASTLLEKQANLFEPCLVLSDCSLQEECALVQPPCLEPGLCEDLQVAMNRLQRLHAEHRGTALVDEEGAYTRPAKDPLGGLMGQLLGFLTGSNDGEIEQAASAVRQTAAKFGPAQHTAATDWTRRLARGERLRSEDLLERRVLLFDECELPESGDGARGDGDANTTPRCGELQAAIHGLVEARARLLVRETLVETQRRRAHEHTQAAEGRAHAARSRAARRRPSRSEPDVISPSTPSKAPEVSTSHATAHSSEHATSPSAAIWAVLVEWGCDESLWSKVQDKSFFVHLAADGTEFSRVKCKRRLRKIRRALESQVAVETVVATDAEDSRQTNRYRHDIPAALVEWGCDAALWRKIKNRTALRKLAYKGDEKHGRRRLATLRAKLLGVADQGTRD